MSVRVGINGFGRIGRNVFRAAAQRDGDLEIVAVNDITDTATLAHLLDYDSIFGRYPGDGRRRSDDHIVVDEREVRVLAERDPAEPALEGPGRGRGHREHRPVHRPRQGRPAPRRRREQGHHLGAGQGARPDGLHRRERRRVRPRAAPRDLERLVHHQLPGAAGEGDDGHRRHRAGLHDHLPRVHQRPAHPRPAPQGPAPGAGRGALDHPDLHRRGAGDRRGHPGAQGPPRRHGAARAHARRLGGRPDGPGRAARRASTR